MAPRKWDPLDNFFVYLVYGPPCLFISIWKVDLLFCHAVHYSFALLRISIFISSTVVLFVMMKDILNRGISKMGASLSVNFVNIHIKFWVFCVGWIRIRWRVENFKHFSGIFEENLWFFCLILKKLVCIHIFTMKRL